MKVTVFFISVLISFNVLSETYVCSQELSKYGRPGEIETLKFERMGNVFKRGTITYQIPHDSKSFLILIRLSTYNSPSLTTVFIDKDTKEWGMSFLTMDQFKRHPPDPLSYGKCLVVN